MNELPMRVLGDAFRVRQVVIDLLSNAIKFTSDGTIEVSACWSDGVCTIAVRDSGIGIEPERLEHIFDSFCQADESTTRRFGGTGLGLTISREIVSCMGGSMQVTSQVGEGSEFSVTLPLVEAEIEVSPLPTIAPELGAHRQVEELQVLLVDDNAVNRRVAGRMLERLGLRYELAADGLEAVAACKARSFDVILIDVQMPNMDGLEATRTIRALPAASRPWIIVLTAGASPEERDATVRAGANEHITKPFRLEGLPAAIEQFAARAAAHA